MKLISLLKLCSAAPIPKVFSKQNSENNDERYGGSQAVSNRQHSGSGC